MEGAEGLDLRLLPNFAALPLECQRFEERRRCPFATKLLFAISRASVRAIFSLERQGRFQRACRARRRLQPTHRRAEFRWAVLPFWQGQGRCDHSNEEAAAEESRAAILRADLSVVLPYDHFVGRYPPL